jgi:bacillithiol system protein YtxJ
MVVFKQSATCSISAHILGNVEALFPDELGVTMGIANVIEDRSLSDRIAVQTGICHESPQPVALRNTQPVWHVSFGSTDTSMDSDACLSTRRLLRPAEG